MRPDGRETAEPRGSDAPELSPEDLHRAFPHLDEEQRITVVELLDIVFCLHDMLRSRSNPERFVRAEAVLRAGADLLRAIIVARRFGASS